MMIIAGKAIQVKRLYDENLVLYEIYVNNHLSGYVAEHRRGFYHYLHDAGRKFYRTIREASEPLAGLQLFDEWNLAQVQVVEGLAWTVEVDEVIVGYVWAEVGEDGLSRHYYSESPPSGPVPTTWYENQMSAIYYLLEYLGYNISVPPGVIL